MVLKHRVQVSAEEPEILQRHDQGCVNRLRGLEDPKLPLSTSTGVQLAPASPKLVEGVFCELLCLDGVLRGHQKLVENTAFE